MRIKKLKVEIIAFLEANGLQFLQAKAVANNIIAAEMAGKKTHGIARLFLIKDWINQGKISTKCVKPVIKIIGNSSMQVNGKNISGYYVLDLALKKAITKMANKDIMLVSLKNTGPSVGYFGEYARLAANSGMIFLGFSNTDGGLAPFGSLNPIWGHNPIAIGLPYKKKPIAFDFGCGTISWGDVYLKSKANENLIDCQIAFNKKGILTNKPKEIIAGGGIFPFGGAKGSSLAFFIEIFAGIFSNSRAGKQVKGGWGTTFILINPYLFVQKKEFNSKLKTFLKELKNCEGEANKKIFYPGERSSNLYKKSIKNKTINIDLKIYKELFKENAHS